MAYNAAITAAAGAAAIARAIRASGVFVEVAPEEFQSLLARAEKPLVVYSQGGFLSTKHRYLLHYRGFTFHTSTTDPIMLPGNAEVISARKIWLP